jgi:hypothetical protein
MKSLDVQGHVLLQWLKGQRTKALLKLPFHKLKCAFSPLMENFALQHYYLTTSKYTKIFSGKSFSLLSGAKVIKTVEQKFWEAFLGIKH